jgi:phosphoribosylglycinamide formyltransferase-1
MYAGARSALRITIAGVRELFNLVVDLDARFAPGASPFHTTVPGVEIVASAAADERTLAWIDEEFGGAWSSEAHAGTNVLAHRGGAPAGFATFDAKGMRFGWLRGLARERDVGVFGPVGVAAAQRGAGLGRLLVHSALTGLRERGYARALIPAVGSESLVRFYGDAFGARVAERFDARALTAQAPSTLVMASGSGSNLQALLDAQRAGTLPVRVTAVVCNNPGAPAIARAESAGVASVKVLRWDRSQEPRERYDARLLESVEDERPELILLLGWMHLLAERFVRAFPDLLNLHPAFLPLDPERDDVGMPDGSRIPAFRGARAVRDALGAGSAWVGATVHAVTPATDRGPVLVRKPLRVAPGEEEPALMERLHPIEHQLVTAAVRRWLYER